MIDNLDFKNDYNPLIFYQRTYDFLKNEKELTENVLEWLYCNYSNIALDALNIIDKFKVKKVISESNQILYVIKNNKIEKFICLPDVHYCSCDKFIKQVIIQEKENMCEHLLSAVIAEKIPLKIKEINLSNEEFAKLLMSI
ncbi:hypothetical protein BCR32DRAFT_289318 [Anaeromyces robustus]|uniref:SWIM-type domain-containing protein n=1 Tax=Anaeromyces robustus TaxID=1754192 RepID=A0A1Y1XP21_9FUNG|nr:hypothetical protein BCR32DRAFT_289318 [Anaeromyces robustus]|eukprot:ORX87497.1 hypothetical protein BCR32DRAFT_289318 [Anaeromyces robustus]